jgi:uncharacterized protein (DUF1800 family)
MTLDSYIALNRFGMGAKSGLRNAISADPRGWLLSQISSQVPPIGYQLPSSQQIVLDFMELKNLKMKLKEDASGEEVRRVRAEIRDKFLSGIGSRFVASANSNAPLHEQMVLFWSNVFTVSIGKNQQFLSLCLAYERDAIRPHVFGHFENMLVAATQHPGMLVYLNNAQSIGPHSKAGEKREKGLNENLARETLELHSLGVNGGYTQADVISLANMITGWTLVNQKIMAKTDKSPLLRIDNNGFAFIPQMHEPDPQTLLGKTYNQMGVDQGLAALRDLAHHPSTAHYMATRLVSHFVGDAPPPECVERVAKVFRDTNGNLAEVTAAVIKLPEAWQFKTPKIKSPYELLVAQIRALNISHGASREQISDQTIFQALNDMGQLPFNANSPAGWTEHSADWASGTGILKRIEWAQALARRTTYDSNIADLANDLFGDALQSSTLQAIQRAPSKVDAITLLLTCPEMQKR